MGIGNWVHCTPSAQAQELITPHGDWKQPTALFSIIEALKLITPHGDWKPDNNCLGDGAVDCLITPHGDWKPPP